MDKLLYNYFFSRNARNGAKTLLFIYYAMYSIFHQIHNEIDEHLT